MRYFKTHTARETARKFKLRHGQIIGLNETSRLMGLMKPTFKDKRIKKPWTLEELLYLIRRAGIQPRSKIGQELGRGSARVIKEHLQTFNSGTKFLNGMPRSWAVQLWGGAAPQGIKTKAGPISPVTNFNFIIIPWVECEKLASKLPTDKKVKRMIKIMAKFQKWIHGTKNPLSKIKRYAND